MAAAGIRGRRLGGRALHACSDIRVEGLQRTEPGTVFASLPFRVGDTYNDEKGVGRASARCSPPGLFKDVRLEVEGDVLVVIVEERPRSPTSTSPASRNSTRTR